MKVIKKITLLIALILSSIIILPNNINVQAAGDEFSIIKKTNVTSDDLKEIWSEWWKVMEKYRKAADEMDKNASPGEQIGAWIMSRNTIYNYLVFFVQYLSQLWLVVWVIFIMYAWYRYMTSVFTWKSAPTDVLSNAIIWVLIVIFSYAIMRILTWFIWLT